MDGLVWDVVLSWHAAQGVVVVVSFMVHGFCALYAQEHSKNGHVEAAEARRLPSRRAWEYGVCRDITPSSAFGRLHSASTATAYGSSWLHIFYV